MLRETIVYIDGAYLSKISKHFGKGRYINIDISIFTNKIAMRKHLKVKKIYYYTAPPFQGSPPTESEEKLRANYDRFVNKMRRLPNFIIREGRCQKVSGEYHQKGVDTLITMDLFEVCYTGEASTIIILTSDTDFVPILNKIRQLGVKVILVYYNDFIRRSRFSMSNHLLTACDEYILLDKDAFLQSKKLNETPKE